MKRRLPILLVLLLVAALPGRALACAACYGASDSPLAEGMNWGIVTLLGIVGTVLTCFLAFFVHIVRKSEAAAAEAETSTELNETTDPTEV